MNEMPARPTDVSVTVLGSSSGMPNPDRAGSGYLLQTGESLSLFDCGSGVAAAFLRNGFDPRKLDRIIISHSHADHVADLPVIIQMLHGMSVERPLDVYLPEDFVEPFLAYLPALYLIKERLRVDLHLHGFGHGLLLQEPFRVEAVANSHQAPLLSEFRQHGYTNQMECFTFLIEIAGKRLMYSGDIGNIDDIRDHLDNLALAIVEAKHIDIDGFLAMAPFTTVEQYVLTHLDDREEVRHLSNRIVKSGMDNVVLAEDGLWLQL